MLWQDVIPADVVLELLHSLKNKTLTGSAGFALTLLLRQALQIRQRDSRGWVTLRYFREDWRRKRKIFKPRMEKKMTRPGMVGYGLPYRRGWRGEIHHYSKDRGMALLADERQNLLHGKVKVNAGNPCCQNGHILFTEGFFCFSAAFSEKRVP